MSLKFNRALSVRRYSARGDSARPCGGLPRLKSSDTSSSGCRFYGARRADAEIAGPAGSSAGFDRSLMLRRDPTGLKPARLPGSQLARVFATKFIGRTCRTQSWPARSKEIVFRQSRRL